MGLQIQHVLHVCVQVATLGAIVQKTSMTVILIFVLMVDASMKLVATGVPVIQPGQLPTVTLV